MKKQPFDIKENAIIPTEQLVQLYSDVEWSAYTKNKEKLALALKNSLYHLSVWNDRELIALIRTVGDGASILYIQDILVKEEYQRQGIGSMLLQRVLKKYENIRQIVLMTDNTDKTKAYYRKNGMQDIQKLEGVCFVKFNMEA